MVNSEIFRIFYRVLADTASNSILFSIGRVLNLECAFRGPGTLRQLILGLPTNIVSTTLLLVAGLTEMSVTPAEPLGHTAAELAFKLDVLCPMFLAVFDSAAN